MSHDIVNTADILIVSKEQKDVPGDKSYRDTVYTLSINWRDGQIAKLHFTKQSDRDEAYGKLRAALVSKDTSGFIEL